MLLRFLLKLAVVVAVSELLSSRARSKAVDAKGLVASWGRRRARWRVLDAVEAGGKVFVIYDYRAFPRGVPARNLFAYDPQGKQLWRAQDIGEGATDAYTQFIGRDPHLVSNFAGYACEIDLETGKVLGTRWTK